MISSLKHKPQKQQAFLGFPSINSMLRSSKKRNGKMKKESVCFIVAEEKHRSEADHHHQTIS